MTLARTESKSFGPIDLPIDALWGAQTARRLRHSPSASNAGCCR